MINTLTYIQIFLKYILCIKRIIFDIYNNIFMRFTVDKISILFLLNFVRNIITSLKEYLQQSKINLQHFTKAPYIRSLVSTLRQLTF